MTIEELQAKDIIVFECLSGSHAYGLNTPNSDVDIKGVFILPEEDYFGLNEVEQVNDEKNDVVYYELKRFMALLSKSNPNILELLYSPEDCIRKMHPVFEEIRKANLLSKQCKESFGGYAMTQVRKAKGLNKKILNPMDKMRKGVLDFCFVAQAQGAIPIREFLEMNEIPQEECGLSSIPHMTEVYGVFHGEPSYNGIVRKGLTNDVVLSSISKGSEPIGYMTFNKSAYSKYCKEYKAYWSWVENRNDARYENTIQHGKNYDAKNMMHTFRLLRMCEEIGKEGLLNVRRADRQELLKIKNGDFDYDELKIMANQTVAGLDQIYDESNLPDSIDIILIDQLLVKVRQQFYKLRRSS